VLRATVLQRVAVCCRVLQRVAELTMERATHRCGPRWMWESHT